MALTISRMGFRLPLGCLAPSTWWTPRNKPISYRLPWHRNSAGESRERAETLPFDLKTPKRSSRWHAWATARSAPLKQATARILNIFSHIIYSPRSSWPSVTAVPPEKSLGLEGLTMLSMPECDRPAVNQLTTAFASALFKISKLTLG